MAGLGKERNMGAWAASAICNSVGAAGSGTPINGRIE